MDLNKIHLNNRFIAELFGNNLIQEIEKDNTEKNDDKDHTPASISKERTILIVHNETASPSFSQSFSFLKDVLAACKLQIKEVDIADAATVSGPRHSTILLFGVMPNEIGLTSEAQKYEINRTNQSQVVFFPSLEEIEKDKQEKRNLWNCLKEVFNIQ